MLKMVARVTTAAIVLAVLAGIPADAGRPVKIKAELIEDCSNCMTTTPSSYSVLPDTTEGYTDGNGVVSEILSHNSVYTLDTLDTLDEGIPGAGTRYAEMVFYSPVENQFPGHVLPPCWFGDYTQMQAVNWSIFADNQLSFTKMDVGAQVDGRARMDFNVRNRFCDTQIFRFILQWHNACIERQDASSWLVTSGSCGAMVNYGEANLQSQGGQHQTLDYGDWRLPFQLLLTEQ